MSARTAARQRAPRQKTKIEKAALRYGTAVLAVVLASAALRSLPLLIAGIVIVAGVAAVRLRRAYRWHRRGGEAAMRRRRRFQGEATFAELRRLPSQGVPIGTVRRSR